MFVKGSLPFFILWLSYFFEIGAFTLHSKPICSVYTPDSILNKKQNYVPYPVGNRMRYGTCTAAAWFHEDYLAVLNLYGEKIITYIFDKEKKEFKIWQQINNRHGLRLKYAEHLNISPDGTMLAISNISHIAIHALDLKTHLINPVPLFSLPCQGLMHNVRFSPNGTYLACASFDQTASISIYKIMNKQHSFTLERVHQKINNTRLKTKAINFTHDSRYAVIAYALAITDSACAPYESLLTVHTFNQDGTLGDSVCSLKGNFSIEDIVFVDSDNALIASDQGHDTLVIYPFDSKTGQIGNDYTMLQNPEAELSFPHGMGVSPNGNYLVVANYGDDKFNVYQIDTE